MQFCWYIKKIGPSAEVPASEKCPLREVHRNAEANCLLARTMGSKIKDDHQISHTNLKYMRSD